MKIRLKNCSLKNNDSCILSSLYNFIGALELLSFGHHLHLIIYKIIKKNMESPL